MWASILMTNVALVSIVLKISKRLTMVDLIKAEDENAIWEVLDNGRKNVRDGHPQKGGGKGRYFRGCA